MTMSSLEGCLQNATLSNLQLIVSRYEINLRETSDTLNLVKQIKIMGRRYIFLIVTIFNWR